MSILIATYLIMYVLFHNTFTGEAMAKTNKDLAIFLAAINFIVGFFAFRGARTYEKKCSIGVESRAKAYLMKSASCFLLGLVALFGLQLSDHSAINLLLWIMMGALPFFGGVFFWLFLSFRLTERLK